MKVTKSFRLPNGIEIPVGAELHFGREGYAFYKGHKVQREKMPIMAAESVTITKNQINKYLELIKKDIGASNYDVRINDEALVPLTEVNFNNGVTFVFDLESSSTGKMIAYSVGGTYYHFPSSVKSYKDIRGQIKMMLAFAEKEDQKEPKQRKDTVDLRDVGPKSNVFPALLQYVENYENVLDEAISRAGYSFQSFSYFADPRYKITESPIEIGKKIAKKVTEIAGLDEIQQKEQVIAIENGEVSTRYDISKWCAAADCYLYYLLNGRYNLGLGFSSKVPKVSAYLAETDFIGYSYGRYLTKCGQAQGYGQSGNFSKEFGESLLTSLKIAYDDDKQGSMKTFANALISGKVKVEPTKEPRILTVKAFHLEILQTVDFDFLYEDYGFGFEFIGSQPVKMYI